MPGRPLRVLLVAPSSRMTGGQAVQAQAIQEGLAGMGVHVRLLPIDLRLPAAVQRMPGLRTALRLVGFVAALLWHVPQADVVHVFSAAYHSFYLWSVPAMLIARLLGKRTILNYRSGEGPEHLRRSARLVRPLMGLAHTVVTPSEYLRDAFARYGIRAVVVNNVVDLSRFRYRERKGMQPVVLVARLLEPLYNIPCALRAFKVLQAAYPQAELRLAGEGPERPSLERLVREEGMKGVTFLGRVSREAMPGEYDRADILLNTPNLDNMPNVLLEAFAAGVPVVSTAAGGIPHLVTHGENGLLAPVGDSEALGAHLLWVMAHQEEAIEMARRARARCAAFTWNQVGEKWLAVYRGEAR